MYASERSGKYITVNSKFNAQLIILSCPGRIKSSSDAELGPNLLPESANRQKISKTGLHFPAKRSILPPVAVASRYYYGKR